MADENKAQSELVDKSCDIKPCAEAVGLENNTAHTDEAAATRTLVKETTQSKKHGLYCRYFGKQSKKKYPPQDTPAAAAASHTPGAAEVPKEVGTVEELEAQKAALVREKQTLKDEIEQLLTEKTKLLEKMANKQKSHHDHITMVPLMRRQSTSMLLKDESKNMANFVTLTPPPSLQNFYVANPRFTAPASKGPLTSPDGSVLLDEAQENYDTVAPFTSQKSLRERLIFKREIQSLQKQVKDLSDQKEEQNKELLEAKKLIGVYKKELGSMQADFDTLQSNMDDLQFSSHESELKRVYSLALLSLNRGTTIEENGDQISFFSLGASKRLELLKTWIKENEKAENWSQRILENVQNWRNMTDKLNHVLDVWQTIYLNEIIIDQQHSPSPGATRASENDLWMASMKEIAQSTGAKIDETVDKEGVEQLSQEKQKLAEFLKTHKDRPVAVREYLIDEISALYSEQNVIKMNLKYLLGNIPKDLFDPPPHPLPDFFASSNKAQSDTDEEGGGIEDLENENKENWTDEQLLLWKHIVELKMENQKYRADLEALNVPC